MNKKAHLEEIPIFTHCCDVSLTAECNSSRFDPSPQSSYIDLCNASIQAKFRFKWAYTTLDFLRHAALRTLSEWLAWPALRPLRPIQFPL
jgi:hypothetical protein